MMPGLNCTEHFFLGFATNVGDCIRCELFCPIHYLSYVVMQTGCPDSALVHSKSLHEESAGYTHKTGH